MRRSTKSRPSVPPHLTRGVDAIEHAARSENLARDIVAKFGADNIDSIHYNRELRTAVPGVTDRRRPDVIVNLKDGGVVLGEVASRSQTTASQVAKARDMSRSLGDREREFQIDNAIAKDGPTAGVGAGADGSAAKDAIYGGAGGLF
jgi:hypothetical protein